MFNARIYSLLFIVLILWTCNLPTGKDESASIDCKNTKFNKTYITTSNLSMVDSILIEEYQKDNSFQHLIKKQYHKINDKNWVPATRSRHTQWVFTLFDNLDIDYDYKFVFQDNDVINIFEVSELVMEPLPQFKKNGNQASTIVYECKLGSWKINGHTYYGGDFELY